MTEPKRKLTFQKEKGLGKLRLRFDEGELKIRLSKRRDAYSLGPKEAQELALWLSAWSLKLIDDAAKGSAKVEEAEANAEAEDGSKAGKRRKHEKKRRKDHREKTKAVAVTDKPHAVADGQQAN